MARDGSVPELFTLYNQYIINLHNTNFLNQPREISTLFLLSKLEYFDFLLNAAIG